MNAAHIIILSLLAVTLVVLAVRSVVKELRGPGEDGQDRTAGNRKAAIKEIEDWRNGK
jgi:hypothetical protein